MLGLMLLLLSVSAVSAPPGYEAAVGRLPARHWALVSSATVDRTSGGQARRDLTIHLTPYRPGGDGQLWHEVGHIVAYSDPSLERDWRRAFWPDGRIVGTPPSRYALTNDREDFAEAYKELIERNHLEDTARERFLRRRVFRPGELGVRP